MGSIIGLCKIADTATELGYHDANTGETLDKTSSFVPAMMVGQRQRVPADDGKHLRCICVQWRAVQSDCAEAGD